MTAAVPARRFVSIDVLRGLTVAFMIFVNDPGDWKHVYAPLDHAEWNGWTLTDLVFPTFLFLVGCSIVFAVQSRRGRAVPTGTILLQILRRALVIFLIKMLLSALPFFHWSHLRIFGVLTRIALCYAAAALLFVWTRNWRVLLGVAGLLLAGYWVLLRWVPVPGFGMPGTTVPFLDPDGNLASYVDRAFNSWTQHWLHTGSLYRGTRDPEGLLSTLPSIATTLLGVLAGMRMARESDRSTGLPGRTTSLVLVCWGALSFAAGELWSVTFPINKNLWTSSYVLLAAGVALVLLALFHFVFDEQVWHDRKPWVRRLAWPFLIFGSNAIFAYALSSLLEIAFDTIKWSGGDGVVRSLHSWLYRTMFAQGGSTNNTSVVWACFFVLLCFVPCWLLWRRKWFLRV